jgi:hypothetical protein
MYPHTFEIHGCVGVLLSSAEEYPLGGKPHNLSQGVGPTHARCIRQLSQHARYLIMHSAGHQRLVMQSRIRFLAVGQHSEAFPAFLDPPAATYKRSMSSLGVRLSFLESLTVIFPGKSAARRARNLISADPGRTCAFTNRWDASAYDMRAHSIIDSLLLILSIPSSSELVAVVVTVERGRLLLPDGLTVS